jgi:hypothetical protein
MKAVAIACHFASLSKALLSKLRRDAKTKAEQSAVQEQASIHLASMMADRTVDTRARDNSSYTLFPYGQFVVGALSLCCSIVGQLAVGTLCLCASSYDLLPVDTDALHPAS